MLVKLLHWLWTEPMRLSLRHALPLGAAARRCLRPLTVSVNTASPSPTVAFYFPVDSSAVWPRLARTYPEVLRC